MCLSTQALVMFLSLLPREIVIASETRVLIGATTGTVEWTLYEDTWCTVAPLRSIPKIEGTVG